MLKAQPQRIASAIIAQPIGRVGDMPPTRSANFEAWTKTLQNHPEATPEVLEAFYQNLYAPGFAYSVDRAFVASCQTPCLVLAGNDAAHPFAIAEEMAQLLPHGEFIPEWKSGVPLEKAKERMQQFLAAHTPVRA
jgi:pimeloyl-ACP methyl ester carboxylesterase